jgi:uncharacterized protein (TIGR02270 family)
VLIRDRPVLEHIVEQHAEEAAFLWTQRDAATDAPHYKRHHLARLDERVEAHVDGLRVAGEAGWRIALEQLERRCEKGELFAAGVLALESGDMRRIEPLVAVAEAAPGVRRGFVGAIAWCLPRLLAPSVRLWDRSTAGFERYLALSACSVHRADTGPEHKARLRDADPRVRTRALRLAGELGRHEHVDLCIDCVTDLDPSVRYWASWSAVLLGDRNAALQALSEFGISDAGSTQDALEVAVRAMGMDRGMSFIHSLVTSGACRKAATRGAGYLGAPSAMPWLIDQMGKDDVARLTGEAFVTICGADLSYDRLARPENTEGDADETKDESAGDLAADDREQRLRWPEPASIRTWWDERRGAFASGLRYLAGRPIDTSTCDIVWRLGTQRQRRAAAFEIALRTPAAPLYNWRSRHDPFPAVPRQERADK